MRSILFVPAHKSHMFEKAFKSEADALCFDLEDSCPGEDNRKQGIENINKHVNKTDKKIIVRISHWEQVDKLHDAGYIMYPKAEGIDTWERINWALGPPAILLIESAMGVMNLFRVMKSYREFKDKIAGIAFGNEDYLADTGCSDYSFAQNMVVTCAKAFGKFAIDTVHVDLDDVDNMFHHKCMGAVSLGFDGKLCIHPDQVAIANKCFTPSKNAYDRAQKVIELSKDEKGVGILDGVYIAPPMVKRAEKIIKKYEHYNNQN